MEWDRGSTWERSGNERTGKEGPRRLQAEESERRGGREQETTERGEARHPLLEETEPQNLLGRGFQGSREQVGNRP